MITHVLIFKDITTALLLLLFFVSTDCRAADNKEQARILVDVPGTVFSDILSDALVQKNLRHENRASYAHVETGTQQDIKDSSAAGSLSKVTSASSSGHLSPPETQQEQGHFSSGTQIPQNKQSSEPRKQQNTLAGGDSLETLSRGEDTPWKRKARLQGMRMRMLYGPEAMYHATFISSTSEIGSRHTAGSVVPLNDIWEITALNHLSLFSLKNESGSAGRESMSVRVGMNMGQSFRPWFAFTPYFNFRDARGEHASIAAGMSKNWTDGTNLAAEIYAWRPWDEGYHTIIEDGRRHGGALMFTFPITKRLTLSTRANYEELELGYGAKSGSQYAGSRYGWNARAYYRLLQRESALMGQGFRNDDLWNEYVVGSELGVFMLLDWQHYKKPEDFNALSPVPQAFAQQFGLSYQHALSPHWGLAAESYIGRDPDRNLNFSDLLGLNMRLTMLMTPHFRIWCALGYSKTSTKIGSDGGAENTVSFGVNYNF